MSQRHPGEDFFNLHALMETRGMEKHFSCPVCKKSYRAPYWVGLGVYDRCLPSSGKIWSHGLNAYHGGKKSYDILRNGTIVASGSVARLGPMISCTDRGREVGTVGIYITGGEYAKYAGDVWSETDHLGRRWAEDGSEDRVLDLNCRSWSSYDETLVRPYAVIGVWVRIEASDWDVRAAEELAEMLDVPLHDEWFDGPLPFEHSRNKANAHDEWVYLSRRREMIKEAKASWVNPETRELDFYEIQDALEAS